MSPHCHFPPLPSSRRTFRLVSLEPGQDDDKVVCHLRVADVPTPTSRDPDCIYNAVSYAWGEGEFERRIRVDEQDVLVRENLWQLLKHFRRRDEPITLWIDFLCINQSDKKEQAEQVQMMDKIYKGARKVMVWLGMPDPKDLLAMELVQSVHETSVEVFLETPGAYNALLHWSNRYYWSRAWVVQEFVLGPDLVVQCGTASLAWTTLSLFLERLERARPSVHSDHAIKMFVESPAYTLMQHKVEYTATPMPLMKLLVRTQRTLCKDPVDKVYCLLGFAEGSSPRPPIRVTYTISRLELIHEILAHCNIQARDVARYVRFLCKILAFEPAMAQLREILTPSALYAYKSLWALPGFVIGELLTCEALDLICDSDGIDQDRLESNPAFQRAVSGQPHKIKSATADAFLDMNVDDLQLRTACTRRNEEQNKVRIQNRISTRKPPTSFLVSVFNSGCAHEDIVIGIACGRISKGLQVVQFLNCDMGFVVDRHFPGSDDAPILGLILCIRGRNKAGQTVTDVETQQGSRYHSLSSEIEGAHDMVRVKLNKRLMDIALLAG